LVAPPFAVMLAFVLPLDTLMCAVFRSGESESGRARLARVMWIEVIALASLAAAWSPFFSDLLTR
jgi:hypothetical protein